MAVRGSGTNTQILLSSRGTNVALFIGGGASFNLQLIGVPGVPPSFAGYGIAFGAGNTFWAKNYLGDLYQIAFDPTGVTPASVVQDYTAGTQIPSHMVGVGVDPVNNILGGVDLTDHNPDLQLFQLTGSANPPVLFDQAFFPAYNPSANGNNIGAVVLKYPRAYGLDVDLGIIGVTYGSRWSARGHATNHQYPTRRGHYLCGERAFQFFRGRLRDIAALLPVAGQFRQQPRHRL